jgi:hypothetical protein
VRTDAGPIPRISSTWTWRDRLEHVRCRLGSFRNRNRRPPGLYAVGNPGRDSEVVVTANYGLTFDVVRRALRRLDVWVLVLDALVDGDRCMECGACQRNCATGAITVEAGVGCAAALTKAALRGGSASPSCGCDDGGGCCG